MVLLETVEVKLEWSDLDRLTYHSRPELVRSPGVHVSDLLRQTALRQNLYTEEDRQDDMPLRILLGLAFEESAARLYPTMHWQPGEVEHGGLAGSPDGLSILAQFDLPNNAAVDEFKYTGKSMRRKGAPTQPNYTVLLEDLKDIREEWIWMHQGMSYVNLLRRMRIGYDRMNLCRFHICWKYGAYVRPFTEIYMRYLVQFSEPELAGNWALLQLNKKHVESGGKVWR